VSQYKALLSTEGIDLRLTTEAIHELARLAARVNDTAENIGARRLATVLETVLDEVSFEGGESGPRTVVIDADEVRRKLEPLVQDQDLRRFIL
jgi:ATP-dependent HslUV protease ATP-binding subunit HslU